MTMKVSDVRKRLKESRYKVDLFVPWHGDGSIIQAHVHITEAYPKEPGGHRETFLTVEMQANDVWSPRRLGMSGLDKEYHRGVKNLPGLGYFYGSSIETEQRVLGFGGMDYKNPARAAAFAKLIQETVKKHNLHYKHPDCELSQLVAALETLGCTEDQWKWCKSQGGVTELRDWIRERESRRPEKTEEEATNA